MDKRKFTQHEKDIFRLGMLEGERLVTIENNKLVAINRELVKLMNKIDAADHGGCDRKLCKDRKRVH